MLSQNGQPTPPSGSRKGRFRITLSCVQCKKRKVKCDRKHPCSSCIKHNVAHECKFPEDQVTLRGSPSTGSVSVFWAFAADAEHSAEKKEISRPTSRNHASKRNLTNDKAQLPREKRPRGSAVAGYESVSSVSAELTQLRTKLQNLEQAITETVGPSETTSPSPHFLMRGAHLSGPSINPETSSPGFQTNKASTGGPPINSYNAMGPVMGAPVSASAKANQEYVSLPPIHQTAFQKPPMIAASSSVSDPPASGLAIWAGVNPYDAQAPDEKFDIYQGYNPIYSGMGGRRLNHGPFSWYSFVQKDSMLSHLWSFQRLPHRKLTFGEPPTLDRDIVGPERSNIDTRAELNKRTMSLGLTVFEGELDRNMNILGRIKLMLPRKRVVKVLVDRYFELLYTYFPIIDENHFRLELERMIGPLSLSDDKHDVQIERRQDMATLGLLLILLRISYLSAFSNQNSENEELLASGPVTSVQHFILSNPISIDIIALAQQCIESFDLYQRTNLAVIQCSIMIRIYASVAPEEGDDADGYESNTWNAMCIQTAYCMGLNRDPSKIHGYECRKADAHLGRKLWFFLKMMDAKSSYQYGFPLMLDEEYTDADDPTFVPGSFAVPNIDMEMQACEFMTMSNRLYMHLRKILRKCIAFKRYTSVCEITKALTEVELEMSNSLGHWSDLVSPTKAPSENVQVKVLKCKLYMNLKSFVLSMFYHLFLDFEAAGKYDLAFFYLRKIIANTCGEFLSTVLDLIRKQREIFGEQWAVSALVLNPAIVFLIHKSNQINISLLIRFKVALCEMDNDEETHDLKMRTSPPYKQFYRKLSSLVHLFVKLLRFSVSCLSRLKHRFYYAWRLSKTHSFIFETVETDEFKKFAFKTASHCFPFEMHHIEELYTIAEYTYKKVKLSLRQEILDLSSIPSDADSGPNLGVNLGDGVKPDVPYREHTMEMADSLTSENYHPSSIVSNGTNQSMEHQEFDFGTPGDMDKLWQQINNFKNYQRGDNEESANEFGNVRNTALTPMVDGSRITGSNGFSETPMELDGSFDLYSRFFL